MREVIIRNSDLNTWAPPLSGDANTEHLRISIATWDDGKVTEEVIFEGSLFDKEKYLKRLERRDRTDELWERAGEL